MSVRAPIPHTCVNCHRPLGISANPPIIPHFQDQGADGGSKHEAWCPICFVKIRAHRETMHHGGPRFAPDFHDQRLVQGMLRAIKCQKCGVESLAHGHTGCLQCGSKLVTQLHDAHFAAVTAGAKDPAAVVKEAVAAHAPAVVIVPPPPPGADEQPDEASHV